MAFSQSSKQLKMDQNHLRLSLNSCHHSHARTHTGDRSELETQRCLFYQKVRKHLNVILSDTINVKEPRKHSVSGRMKCSVTINSGRRRKATVECEMLPSADRVERNKLE